MVALSLSSCYGEPDQRFLGMYFDPVENTCVFIGRYPDNECGAFVSGRPNNMIKGKCTGSWMMQSVRMTIPVISNFPHSEFRNGDVTFTYDRVRDTLSTDNGKRTFVKEDSDRCRFR